MYFKSECYITSASLHYGKEWTIGRGLLSPQVQKLEEKERKLKSFLLFSVRVSPILDINCNELSHKQIELHMRSKPTLASLLHV